MKGYGLPRNDDVGRPDLEDVRHYALKSSAGHLPGPGGEIRSHFKSSAKKRKIRRYWKSKVRARDRYERYLIMKGVEYGD